MIGGQNFGNGELKGKDWNGCWLGFVSLDILIL